MDKEEKKYIYKLIDIAELHLHGHNAIMYDSDVLRMLIVIAKMMYDNIRDDSNE